MARPGSELRWAPLLAGILATVSGCTIKSVASDDTDATPGAAGADSTDDDATGSSDDGAAGAPDRGGLAGAPGADDEGGECGDVTADGQCDGDVLSFCQAGALEILDCAEAGMVCSGDADGADCVDLDRAVACGDLTAEGTCDGAFMRYCDPDLDVARTINCAAYGQDCDPTAGADGGANCVSFGACGDVSEDGTCEENELRFCEDDQLYVFDCGLDECGVVDSFADCFVADFADGCGDETAEGRCNGNSVVRCLGNMISTEDCEVLGLECAEGDDGAACARGDCPANCPDGYSCTDGLCAPESEPEAEWTVAVYMVGENNLSDALWRDLNELEEVGSTDEVRIVAQVEYSSTFAVESPSEFRTGSYRMLVERDDDSDSSASLESATDLGDSVNMGSSEGLADFMRWVAENHPAQRIALILSDHGIGYQGGFYDEGEDSLMSLQQLVAGIRDSGVHLDLLGMDACLMGMHEVGMAFRGVADHLVASLEVVPGAGYPYDDVLTALTATPTMSAADLGSTIVEDFADGFASGLRARDVTMATYDLSRMPAFNDELAAFAETMLREAPGSRSGIRDAVASTDILRAKTADITDVGSIFSVFSELGGGVGTAAGDAQTFLGDSGPVLSARGTGTWEATSGLAVYFPEAAWSEYNAGTYANYWSSTSFLPMQTWRAFVSSMTHTEDEVVTPAEGAVDWFSVVLSWSDEPDGDSSNADLDLYVYEPNGDFGTPANGSTTANGLLSADSFDSEIPSESYELRADHETGTYLILVSLYDIPEGEQAFPRIQIYRNDIAGGVQTLLRAHVVDRELVEVPMDDSNLLTDMITAETMQGVRDLTYSNLWYATTIEVAASAEEEEP